MSYILCVDDEPSIASLLRHIMTLTGHEAEIAVDGRDALDKIAKREPDLIILDRSMPHLDGISVCRAVKTNPFLSRVPVLMLTAQSSIDNKLEGYEAGADDYLGKPFEPRELSARVNALLRLVQRESERNPSSGLPGGGSIGAEIDRRLALGEEFAVVYFDLDHFKPFADHFGFAQADRVITGVGALLGKIARANGVFAGHIGGDDFLVVSGPAEADSIADDGRRGFARLIDGLIDPVIVAEGSFASLDRDGRAARFPIAKLTAVIVTVIPSQWVSLSHLGEAAAAWKKAARAREAQSA